MECNRDEAERAKEIAENKFSSKDITGAKKFALKAQSLYPGLVGISQLLAILDVYVAAEIKINGELDFYGILGVSPLADDDTVRKHYRKLALTLHPDKNKSIGAEGAFKYVSEAWKLLSDKDKRSAYDKRNGRIFKHKVKTQNGGSRVPTTQNGFHNFKKSTAARTKVTTNTTRTKDTNNPSKGNNNDNNINATTKTGPTYVPSLFDKQTLPKTFWTVCKRCKLQYEFLRMYLNRNLLCPTCHGPFLAIETPPPNTNIPSKVLENSQESNKKVLNPETCNTRGVEAGHGDSSNHTSTQWGPFSKTNSPDAVAQAAYGRVKRGREEAQEATKREEALRRNHNKKGAKSSSKHLNSVKMKQDVNGFDDNKQTGPVGSLNSSVKFELKNDVSNTGVKNRLIKKATMEIKKKLHEWSSETDALANGDSKNHRTEPLVIDVPDPDFNDFDRDRSEKCFEEGQVWAAYDDPDGMPRLYAMIRHVISLDPFKMKVCWLNSKPNNKPGPFSGFLEAFGEFKVGKHEIVSVPNYFSHKANFRKQASGNIRVYPRKGDVCALYRNDQTSDLVKRKYEIVEVDEYNEETGTTVTPLVKVAGFKTVFHRHLDPKETRVILENEKIRFSHQIPSYLLTGQESSSAPKGCRELDPAAIPPEFLQLTENVDEAEKIMAEDEDEDDDDQMLDKDCILADFKEADNMDDEQGSKY